MGIEVGVKEKKYFLINENCPTDPVEYLVKNGVFPFEYVTEVTKEESLNNLSITITYGLTFEEAKAHFSGNK